MTVVPSKDEMREFAESILNDESFKKMGTSVKKETQSREATRLMEQKVGSWKKTQREHVNLKSATIRSQIEVTITQTYRQFEDGVLNSLIELQYAAEHETDFGGRRANYAAVSRMDCQPQRL